MTATEDETKAIRDDIAWAETGPWTEITAEVEARVAKRASQFDRWLKQVQADAWDVGYQRGLRDEMLDITHGADNPYREDEA